MTETIKILATIFVDDGYADSTETLPVCFNLSLHL